MRAATAAPKVIEGAFSTLLWPAVELQLVDADNQAIPLSTLYRPVDPFSTVLTANNDADFFVRHFSPLFLLLAREEKWRKLVAGQ